MTDYSTNVYWVPTKTTVLYTKLRLWNDSDRLFKEVYLSKKGCSHLKKHLQGILKKTLKPKY